MWAIIAKEFRQLRRDRRTLAMMILLPVLLLVVFGYAASFDVHSIPTTVDGPLAHQVAQRLSTPFSVTSVNPTFTASDARDQLRNSDAVVAVVTSTSGVQVLMDGTQLFSVQTAERALGQQAAASAQGLGSVHVDVLFNPNLSTSWVMIPGLAGLILVFIGTLITSLGVVKERQNGTLEQLAVMPFRASQVIMGKIAPYLLVAAVDLILVLVVGIGLFHVPFVGNIATFILGSAIFLLVTLGIGILISTLSQNQGQAIQMSFMILLPQVLLSGLIFPVSSMAPGVRWISYILPLTYFIDVSRGVMLKNAPIGSLVMPLVMLGVLAIVVLSLAIARFRHDLAPNTRTHDDEVFETVGAP